MPKGKKFNVAEEYFREKELKLRKELNATETKIALMVEEFDKMRAEYNEVKNENAKLNIEITKLLEYTELSKSEIRRACRKDMEMADLLKILPSFSKMF